MSSHEFLYLVKAKPLSSVSVNRYRRINIWTAILGRFLVLLPVVFARRSRSSQVVSNTVRRNSMDRYELHFDFRRWDRYNRRSVSIPVIGLLFAVSIDGQTA
ncbi:DUF2684 family protein [Lonsdalea populi]|uniref:DUF2684 family protein n=1 Tax=Lonsdalea populi TaxID=1172565 RepID=A0A3N0UBP2_9GAMM|nr:DUF2684 family protein [Lonsdalea populi]ROH77227.1 DUF2684 family protein [Lonsdalea populi]ROH77631.1 DUF2684 family protein [Lonsdalea populi]